MSRWNNFSDDEIYILSRNAIIGMSEVGCDEQYDPEALQLHEDLLNELINERKARGM